MSAKLLLRHIKYNGADALAFYFLEITKIVEGVDESIALQSNVSNVP